MSGWTEKICSPTAFILMTSDREAALALLTADPPPAFLSPQDVGVVVGLHGARPESKQRGRQYRMLYLLCKLS